MYAYAYSVCEEGRVAKKVKGHEAGLLVTMWHSTVIQ